MTYQFDIKSKTTPEELKRSYESIHSRHPDRIPVILERNRNSVSIPGVRKNKYLVPNDLTVSQFQYVIRKRIRLKSEEALFLFTDQNVLVSGSTLMSQVYNLYKDDSGYLLLLYSAEETFG